MIQKRYSPVKRLMLFPIALLLVFLFSPTARPDNSFKDVVSDVNKKVVKIFGAGGIRGLHSYGTGILVSPDGYVFTINSHILDTRDLRLHMWDGTRVNAKVVA